MPGRSAPRSPSRPACATTTRRWPAAVPDATDYTFDGNWAPRLGLIYDINGDGKTKIYGSWGRFFQKIPQDMAVRALSVETGFTSAFWGDANMTDS